MSSVSSVSDFSVSGVMFSLSDVMNNKINNNYRLIMVLTSNYDETNGVELFEFDEKRSKFDIKRLIYTVSWVKGPNSCRIWATTIDEPELKTIYYHQLTHPLSMVYNSYAFMGDCSMCGEDLTRQNVLILDFRHSRLQGKEYIYLPNHKQLFFGSAREQYLKKMHMLSELNGLKKYYEGFYGKFNFPYLDTVIRYCKRNTAFMPYQWVAYRANQIEKLRNAGEVFQMSVEDVFKRFPNIDCLKQEIKMAYQYRKELCDLYDKLLLR